MSKIRYRMTKPFISTVLVVAKARYSAATYKTHVVLIFSRIEDDDTEKDRWRFGGNQRRLCPKVLTNRTNHVQLETNATAMVVFPVSSLRLVYRHINLVLVCSYMDEDKSHAWGFKVAGTSLWSLECSRSNIMIIGQGIMGPAGSHELRYFDIPSLAS